LHLPGKYSWGVLWYKPPQNFVMGGVFANLSHISTKLGTLCFWPAVHTTVIFEVCL